MLNIESSYLSICFSISLNCAKPFISYQLDPETKGVNAFKVFGKL